MSMSSSLSPISGANFPPIVACSPHLGHSISQDQSLVLADLAFSPLSDELEKSSSPGHGHFLCLLQKTIDQTPKKDTLVVQGGWNAKVGKDEQADW